MVQRLRTMAALPKYPGSILSTHIAAHNHPNSRPRGSQTFSWPPWVSGTHPYTQNRNKSVKAGSNPFLYISVLARMILHMQSLATRASHLQEFQECYHRLISLILQHPHGRPGSGSRGCLPSLGSDYNSISLYIQSLNPLLFPLLSSQGPTMAGSLDSPSCLSCLSSEKPSFSPVCHEDDHTFLSRRGAAFTRVKLCDGRGEDAPFKTSCFKVFHLGRLFVCFKPW